MTTITATDRIPVQTRRRPSAGQDNLSALITLARRRLALKSFVLLSDSCVVR
jgi:hypothetical protein